MITTPVQTPKMIGGNILSPGATGPGVEAATMDTLSRLSMPSARFPLSAQSLVSDPATGALDLSKVKARALSLASRFAGSLVMLSPAVSPSAKWMAKAGVTTPWLTPARPPKEVWALQALAFGAAIQAIRDTYAQLGLNPDYYVAVQFGNEMGKGGDQEACVFDPATGQPLTKDGARVYPGDLATAPAGTWDAAAHEWLNYMLIDAQISPLALGGSLKVAPALECQSISKTASFDNPASFEIEVETCYGVAPRWVKVIDVKAFHVYSVGETGKVYAANWLAKRDYISHVLFDLSGPDEAWITEAGVGPFGAKQDGYTALGDWWLPLWDEFERALSDPMYLTRRVYPFSIVDHLKDPANPQNKGLITRGDGTAANPGIRKPAWYVLAERMGSLPSTSVFPASVPV